MRPSTHAGPARYDSLEAPFRALEPGGAPPVPHDGRVRVGPTLLPAPGGPDHASGAAAAEASHQAESPEWPLVRLVASALALVLAAAALAIACLTPGFRFP